MPNHIRIPVLILVSSKLVC